ncbi:uncharacterized protein LOC121908207 isoform X2 [Thunnus maccoyii]|uniref:uncharacterized protein LOC121908207 isoform X2 n=1 Tax=Thunnus maccoyii TaxID=8240 RepID=UPI001C4B0B96|nr:uncharacterized protein LOC121908207 isoform X2 [Thunnus maccoyii]
MSLVVLLFTVCVVYSRETQGSSDVTTVFMQKGKDLHLHVNKPVVLVEDSDFRWKFNNTHNVLRLFPDNRTIISSSYEGRAEFSLQNHSLLLKNVKQSDSGDYTALITADEDQRLAEYKVIIQGSSDVTTVFVQKGKDLRLDVKKPVVLEKRSEFRWKFNNTHNVVRLFPDNETRVSSSYVGRAEFSLQSHSLLLKNVQQSDSGDYTALIIGEKNQRLAEYKVIIQDPVSPVQLSVDSVSNSTESCNLTVSCRTERSHISSTFECNNQNCYQKGGEQSEVTSSDSSLHVYLLNDSIICNHSNQVSWKEDLKKIRTFCPLNTDPVSPVNLSVDTVSNSTESCNLTVSCSTERSHISSTFGCDNQTCYQEGGEQSEVTCSGSSLHVYLLNDSIICNHSNQVSWKEDLKKIRTLCPLNTDPVSPVNLSVDSVCVSTESCNLTVSCRTERSHISSTFGCDNQTCYQKGGEQSEVTFSGSSLRVYLLNDYIICNHSNQVSWTKDLKKIRTLCPLNTATNGRLRIGIIVSCLVVIFVFALAFSKESLYTNSAKTVNAVPQVSST